MKTAVFIDLDFFIRKLNFKFPLIRKFSPIEKADFISNVIYKYVTCHLSYKKENNELYRIYVYDCPPIDLKIHHPLTNHLVDYSKSFMAQFRSRLHNNIRKLPSTALRLGKLDLNNKRWKFRNPDFFKKIIKEISKMKEIEELLKITEEDLKLKKLNILNKLLDMKLDNKITEEELESLKEEILKKLLHIIGNLKEDDIILDVGQKQVDMKIGMDITHITLKKIVNKIILISGDSDFVPVAKLARTEGVIFVLDPMNHDISVDLSEHIDAVRSPINRKKCIEKLGLSEFERN